MSLRREPVDTGFGAWAYSHCFQTTAWSPRFFGGAHGYHQFFHLLELPVADGLAHFTLQGSLYLCIGHTAAVLWNQGNQGVSQLGAGRHLKEWV